MAFGCGLARSILTIHTKKATKLRLNVPSISSRRPRVFAVRLDN